MVERQIFHLPGASFGFTQSPSSQEDPLYLQSAPDLHACPVSYKIMSVMYPLKHGI